MKFFYLKTNLLSGTGYKKENKNELSENKYQLKKKLRLRIVPGDVAKPSTVY